MLFVNRSLSYRRNDTVNSCALLRIVSWQIIFLSSRVDHSLVRENGRQGMVMHFFKRNYLYTNKQISPSNCFHMSDLSRYFLKRNFL